MQPYDAVTNLLPPEREEPVRLEMTERLNRLRADMMAGKSVLGHIKSQVHEEQRL